MDLRIYCTHAGDLVPDSPKSSWAQLMKQKKAEKEQGVARMIRIKHAVLVIQVGTVVKWLWLPWMAGAADSSGQLIWVLQQTLSLVLGLPCRGSFLALQEMAAAWIGNCAAAVLLDSARGEKHSRQ